MSAISAVSVFCGSRTGADPAHVRLARDLGTRLAEGGIRLVYGGGGIGLMGEVASATLAAGGRVTGVIPDFLVAAEVAHEAVDDMVEVETMHDRKARMFALSDAVFVLPGGIGTLDELIEVMSWRQLRLHDKPIVLIDDDGYWAPFRALVRHVVEAGFAGRESLDLFAVAPSPAAAIASLSD